MASPAFTIDDQSFTPIGGGDLSLGSVEPNPSVDQTDNGTDGGAGNLMGIINTIGRWGTTITSVASGRPVATTTQGQPIGAPGSGSRAAANQPSMSGILVLLAFGAIILLLIKR